MLELVPWVKQWHNEPDPDFDGQRLGEYFEGFIDTEARALGLTRNQMRTWSPPWRRAVPRQRQSGKATRKARPSKAPEEPSRGKKMPIQEVTLKNFTVFEDTAISLVEGVNLFIGENGTGKSHLLKLIYSVVKVLDARERKGLTSSDREVTLLEDKLRNVFRPESLGRLVRRPVGTSVEVCEAAIVQLKLSSGASASLTLPSNPAQKTNLQASTWASALSPVFLPTRELLSIYEGFIGAYDKWQVPFDETYYDACIALSGPSLRGKAAERARPVLEAIEELVGARVVLEDGRFYLKGGDQYEAHLAAEGLRKLGMLARLVENGSIAPGSVLLWDEPETSLNPKMLARLDGLLDRLAGEGMQILISTHDYLLAHKLSLLAEYKQTSATMRFFSLSRDRNGPVSVEWAPTIADIQNNPILEEYVKLYEQEQQLMLEELKSDPKKDA
jgi:predicted ATPase